VRMILLDLFITEAPDRELYPQRCRLLTICSISLKDLVQLTVGPQDLRRIYSSSRRQKYYRGHNTSI